MNALRKLTERQRIAVVLVHGYGWTLAEVAQLLDIKVTTVQTHLERGLARLRVHLEVTPDA
jgi:RNA polymerase sigma factor (sigma-70 family)